MDLTVPIWHTGSRSLADAAINHYEVASLKGLHVFETMIQGRRLLASALQLLDESGVPAEIGAHLDLALNRLDELIEATLLEENASTKVAK